MRNVTECQRRLIDKGYLPAVDPDTLRPSDDGTFGQKSLDAYNHYRASLGKPPVTPPVHLDALNADLFPEEQPAPLPPKPSIFSNLATIGDLLSLLKGKTMTTDQITGILRLLLGLVSGFFIAKGIGSADLWNWIIAGVLAAVPGVWSWISNRPKTIVPISQK